MNPLLSIILMAVSAGDTSASHARRTLEKLQERVQGLPFVRTARIEASPRVQISPATTSTPEVGSQSYYLTMSFEREFSGATLLFSIDVTDTECGALTEQGCVSMWAASVSGPRELPSSNVRVSLRPAELPRGATINVTMNKTLTPEQPLGVVSRSGDRLPALIKERGGRLAAQAFDAVKATEIEGYLNTFLKGLDR
jgi:hypothetical protein